MWLNALWRLATCALRLKTSSSRLETSAVRSGGEGRRRWWRRRRRRACGLVDGHVLDVRTRHSAHGEVLQFTQCYNRGEVDWLGWLSNDAPCCIGYSQQRYGGRDVVAKAGGRDVLLILQIASPKIGPPCEGPTGWGSVACCLAPDEMLTFSKALSPMKFSSSERLRSRWPVRLEPLRASLPMRSSSGPKLTVSRVLQPRSPICEREERRRASGVLRGVGLGRGRGRRSGRAPIR